MKTMQEMFDRGDAIDLSDLPVTEAGAYEIPADWNIEGFELCDLKIGRWIGTVFRDEADPTRRLAFLDVEIDRPGLALVWLR